MKIERATFSKWLKRELKVRRLRHVEIAKDVGVDVATLQSWCYGISMPSTLNMDSLLPVIGWHMELNGEPVTCYDLPDKLNAIRADKKITHEKLSELANVKRYTLTWCCQSKQFRFEKMYKICDVLGATLEMLPDEEGEENENKCDGRTEETDC